jgi:hypothetical protein
MFFCLHMYHFVCILIVMYFIVIYFYYYVTCAFVSLSILIVMYVPFCVFCLIVLFCVLSVCKFVPDCCHRDIRTLFIYLNSVFSVHFSQF